MTSIRLLGDQKPAIISVLTILSTSQHLKELCGEGVDACSPAEMIDVVWNQSYLPEYVPFVKWFTPGELAELARFHRFLDERVNTMRERRDSIRTFLESPDWCEIVKHANETLERIST